MTIGVRRALVALASISLSAAPTVLPAQMPDSAFVAAWRVTRDARRVAERGDTASLRRALVMLDSAEGFARIAPIYMARTTIATLLAESLFVQAKRQPSCAAARNADLVVEMATMAMPMDDLSNDRGALAAVIALPRLRDSIVTLRSRLC